MRKQSPGWEWNCHPSLHEVEEEDAFVDVAGDEVGTSIFEAILSSAQDSRRWKTCMGIEIIPRISPFSFLKCLSCLHMEHVPG